MLHLRTELFGQPGQMLGALGKDDGSIRERLGGGLFPEDVISLTLQPGERAFYFDPFSVQCRETVAKTINLYVEHLHSG
jgi:hypothetical protein